MGQTKTQEMVRYQVSADAWLAPRLAQVEADLEAAEAQLREELRAVCEGNSAVEDELDRGLQGLPQALQAVAAEALRGKTTEVLLAKLVALLPEVDPRPYDKRRQDLREQAPTAWAATLREALVEFEQQQLALTSGAEIDAEFIDRQRALLTKLLGQPQEPHKTIRHVLWPREALSVEQLRGLLEAPWEFRHGQGWLAAVVTVAQLQGRVDEEALAIAEGWPDARPVHALWRPSDRGEGDQWLSVTARSELLETAGRKGAETFVKIAELQASPAGCPELPGPWVAEGKR